MKVSEVKIVDCVDILKHATGSVEHVRRYRWGYRNYFVHHETPEIIKLLEEKLLYDHGYRKGYKANLYHVTKKGLKLIGLGPAAFKRAREDLEKYD